ncbi:MAG: grasp-with-spasm system ATP-grasp peptide maturase [Bacteroidales bacterium]|jgi:ATP-GRASP peptide maturase of grasp-with-spasm system|nr:grasp-with-spasm system ATP-grasp peptide maturase [Bacteroidales bacterium]
MILIYSHDIEFATTKVLEWIHYYGGQFARINNGSFNEGNLFSFTIGNDENRLRVDEQEVTSYWYRRSKIPGTSIENKNWSLSLKLSINNHLKSELIALNNGIATCSKRINSLSHPATSKSEKINDLIEASNVGLTIPPSIVTNKKSELLKFINNHGDVIVKNIGNAIPHYINNRIYSTYTSSINEKDIINYPDKIFPAMFQKKIKKKLEIRSFIVKNDIYSAALFSQQHKKTSTDYRKYTSSNPIRITPYKLPHKIEQKILNLMKNLRLDTGSIDLIRSEDDFIFLEVNPVGQFGWISSPCNYHLEKKIAENILEL